MATRRVLVTGAGSGIGKGIAAYLCNKSPAKHGVMITDLKLETAQAAAEELRAAGGNVIGAYALDVSNKDSIRDLMAQLQDNPPDVLVNNAGIQHVSPLEDFPDDKWQLLVDVMLVGCASMTKAVLPSMRENGYGRIVNIGSIHSLIASKYKSAYVAAKHGLVGFSKVMALETADCDITINTVCPAYVMTPLVEAQIEGQAKAHGMTREQVVAEIFLKPMPKQAFISLDELAGTTEFLMSDHARNITGQTLALDGGWTVQ
ncbi:uncharacterized protein MONBRDRAFT_15581 [Monosiga brevicollis MX1]|uniref:3-oxoacyl-[acyl-carrier-protein] reductase n=1 Tax=Monosiga brevicollis TaxID=81824 RepID=A9UUS4_MONBE|nr:uncharacterized protein MONBRDRAFT_15581 [Monosiga brevicollis MX1]EDQ90771.1 predicted protein [Monosiga brevicollis MX1]|eukprot:XP_001744068.1 hypothetical protein [Monosiga brevicollis MX1]